MKKLHWDTGLVPGMYGFLRWLALACLMVGAASSAFATKTYSDNGDGTVTDPTTGLIWMRCSMGQTWSGATSTCTGTASGYTWAQANALTGTVTFAGQSDWRLPSVRELQTIPDRSRVNPATDPISFPKLPPSFFWSATAAVYESSYYSSSYRWLVSLYGGGNLTADTGNLQNRNLVLLVRAGQSFSSLLNLARPATDYVDHGNGTVTHTPTGLMWQRCISGQTWTGSTCSGSATGYTWEAAMASTDSFADHSDWRLPTIEELESLVDYKVFDPAANGTVFPGAKSATARLWSMSVGGDNPDSAWDLGLLSGNSGLGGKSNVSWIQFVRDAQIPESPSLTVGKNGSGTVTSSPVGINCSATCSANFSTGTSVTLTAAPSAGSNFGGWSGACIGTGSCVVNMTVAQSVTATFYVIVPSFSLSPTSLSFAAQDVGTTSAAKTVTFTNTGGAALNITSIVTNGDFARTTTCGATLAQSASCTIDVTFTPSQAGANLSSLVITSNAASSPNTVSLSGTGTTTLPTPVCSLTANPAFLFAGGSSKLTASCSPAATSYVWTGGTCASQSTNSCIVTPAANISFTLKGVNVAGTGSAVSTTVAVVTAPPIYSGGLYEGIYQWAPGYYLTVQQHGTVIIATNYFNADGNYSFTSPDGHVLPVPQMDLFDLYHGSIAGANATISGTEFHRACNVSYNFAFTDNGNITVTKTAVSNTAAATQAGISCSAITMPIGTVLVVPKILF